MKAAASTAREALETADFEAARYRNSYISLVLQKDIDPKRIPKKPLMNSQNQALLDNFPWEWLRKGGWEPDRKLAALASAYPPPMLGTDRVDPAVIALDAMIRSTHLHTQIKEIELAVATLEQAVYEIHDETKRSWETRIANALSLELTLRPSTRDRANNSNLLRFWDQVRSEVLAFQPYLGNPQAALPPPPRPEVLDPIMGKTPTWHAMLVRKPWEGSHIQSLWLRGRPNGVFPKDYRDFGGLDQQARVAAGQALQALLCSYEEVDLRLSVLLGSTGWELQERVAFERYQASFDTAIGDAKPPVKEIVNKLNAIKNSEGDFKVSLEELDTATNDLKNYRSALGDRITAPFGVEIKRLAAARELDKVLDKLEVLFAFPVRPPQALSLRESVAELFPDPGATTSPEAKVRHRRYVSLLRHPSPAVLPPAPEFVASHHEALEEPILTREEAHNILQLVLSPDGRSLVIFREGVTDVAISIPDGKVLGEFDSFAGKPLYRLNPVTTGAFSSDGRLFAAVSNSVTTRLFNTADWSLVCDIKPQWGDGKKEVSGIHFLADNRYLFVQHRDVFSIYHANGTPIYTRPSTGNGIVGAIRTSSPDGRLYAFEAGGLFNIDTGQSITVIRQGEHYEYQRIIALQSRDMNFALIGNKNAYANIIPVRVADESQTLDEYSPWALFSHDGRVFAHTQGDRFEQLPDNQRRVIFRRSSDWQPIAHATTPRIFDAPAQFSADNRQLVFVTDRKVVAVDIDLDDKLTPADITAAKNVRSFTFDENIMHRVISANGKTVAVVTKLHPTTVHLFQPLGD